MIPRPIVQLSPEVTAKIAAGEVIERPASVVKELVENALDARATVIHIEVRQGGRELIAVSDDGHGIPADDMLLTVYRHATSKLRSSEDLDAITTLGFRGEALASIAAAGRLELLSATEDGAASLLVAENGSVASHGTASRARGTTVTVRGLFRYTPARLKFLKSIPTEHARMHDVVAAYALAYPEVALTLVVEGRETFSTPGNGDPRAVLTSLYRDDVQHLIPLTVQHRLPPGVHFAGFVGTPLLHRATRDHIWMFINRRWIQSRRFSYAVEQAYQTLLMAHRRPVVVLNLDVDPADVDVNVHPTKSEVRLSNEHELFGSILRCVRDTVMQSPVVPAITFLPTAAASPGAWFDSNGSDGREPAGRDVDSATITAGSGNAEPGRFNDDQPVMFPKAPALRVLGQIDATYIIAEGPDGLYLIDQHAAHERIMYDRIIDARTDGGVRQTLLEPAVLELQPGQAAVVLDHVRDFQRLGFEFEPFGSRSVLIRAVPGVIGRSDAVRTALAVVDELRAEGTGSLSFGEAAAWSVACKASVKAGQPLSRDEQVELVRQLETTRSPQTCAHGRPTMVHLSVSQLERQFGRR